MANRTEVINMKATEAEKAEWKDAAAEYNKTLSDFIRSCVEKELARDGTDMFETDTTGSMELGPVLERLDSIDTTLRGGAGSVTHRLTAIEGQLTDDPAARDLASTVYSVLPDESDFRGDPIHPDPGFDVELYSSKGVLTGDVEDISRYLTEHSDVVTDVTETDVERALDDLRSDLHNVHRTDDGRYYRS